MAALHNKYSFVARGNSAWTQGDEDNCAKTATRSNLGPWCYTLCHHAAKILKRSVCYDDMIWKLYWPFLIDSMVQPSNQTVRQGSVQAWAFLNRIYTRLLQLEGSYTRETHIVREGKATGQDARQPKHKYRTASPKLIRLSIWMILAESNYSPLLFTASIISSLDWQTKPSKQENNS